MHTRDEAAPRSPLRHLGAGLSLLFTEPRLTLLLALGFGLFTLALYNSRLVPIVMQGNAAEQMQKQGAVEPESSGAPYLDPPELEPESPRADSAKLRHVRASFHLEAPRGQTLRVAHTGCLRAIYVNDIAYTAARTGCRHYYSQAVDGPEGALHAGLNTVVVVVSGGRAWQDGSAAVYPAYSHWSIFAGLYLSLGCALLAALRALRFGAGAIVLMGVALFFCLIYYYGTDYARLGTDTNGHLEYIGYLLTVAQLPPPLAGKQMYQPPLYHLLCAAAFRLWQTVSLGDPMWGARFLSLSLYLGFLLTGLVTLRRFVRGGTFRLLCYALLLLWTMGTGLGGTLNNDALSWLCYAQAVLWLARWHASRKPWQLALVLAITGVAFLTKNTAFALPLLTGAVALSALRPWRWPRSRKARRRARAALCAWPVAAALLALAACAGLNLGRTAYYRADSSQAIPYLVGNASLYNYQSAPGTLDGYLGFDYRKFTRNPISRQAFPARNNLRFWEAFLHSWLLGDEGRQLWPSLLLARLQSAVFPFLLLTIAALTGWRYAAGGALTRRRMQPWILLALGMIASLMAARVNITINHSAHARYIYAITIVTAVLLGQGLAWLRRRRLYLIMLGVCSITGIFIALGVLLMGAKISSGVFE